MNKQSFIDYYTRNLKQSDKDEFLTNNEVLPCRCGEHNCDGWKMVLKDPAKKFNKVKV